MVKRYNQKVTILKNGKDWLRYFIKNKTNVWKNYWQILNLIYNSHIENANICLIVVGG